MLSGAQSSATSSTPDDLEAAWSALSRGEAIVLMRHALAPGTGDPSEFDADDCATQRNLSAQGRSQAKSIGDTFRDHGIGAAHILSSFWCRCVETAELLGLGKVTPTDALNSFYEDRQYQTSTTQSARDIIDVLIKEPTGKPTIMVTHQVNISALTGQFTQSGEIKIVTLVDDEIHVLASVPAQ